MNYRFLIIGLLSLFFCSCERDVDVELPKSEEKLVIQSFLSEDQMSTKVKVTLSQPLSGGTVSYNFQDVNNATVTINGVAIPFIQNGLYEINASNLTIEKGQTYALKVSTPDGKSVTSTTTVPNYGINKVNLSNFRTDSESSSKLFTATVEDDHSEFNYYAINGKHNYNEGGINKENDLDFEVFPFYDDDDFVDKKLIINDIRYGENTSGITDAKIVLSIYHTDSHFNKYHKSIEKQDEDNPLKEPSQIYSNIEGGFGVFASYVLEKKEFPIP